MFHAKDKDLCGYLSHDRDQTSHGDSGAIAAAGSVSALLVETIERHRKALLKGLFGLDADKQERGPQVWMLKSETLKVNQTELQDQVFGLLEISGMERQMWRRRLLYVVLVLGLFASQPSCSTPGVKEVDFSAAKAA